MKNIRPTSPKSVRTRVNFSRLHESEVVNPFHQHYIWVAQPEDVLGQSLDKRPIWFMRNVRRTLPGRVRARLKSPWRHEAAVAGTFFQHSIRIARLSSVSELHTKWQVCSMLNRGGTFRERLPACTKSPPRQETAEVARSADITSEWPDRKVFHVKIALSKHVFCEKLAQSLRHRRCTHEVAPAAQIYSLRRNADATAAAATLHHCDSQDGLVLSEPEIIICEAASMVCNHCSKENVQRASPENIRLIHRCYHHYVIPRAALYRLLNSESNFGMKTRGPHLTPQRSYTDRYLMTPT